ncbi:MAG: hypothetical protein WCI11_10475 [Candidatus Methylumidiphilus sp.]|nr:hypothetical protein [Pseudomonadota bacterium]
MKVLVACIDDREFEVLVDVHELCYDRASNHFSMPCVMGDDWFQRVNCGLELNPIDVRYIDRSAFVLLGKRDEAQQFSDWLVEAEEKVVYGYRNMRG